MSENDDELGDEDWDARQLAFEQRLEAISNKLKEDAEKLREIGDKLIEVSGTILIEEIEEYLNDNS